MKWMKSNKHCTSWILQILCYYFTIYSRQLKTSSLLQWSIPSFVGPQSCKKGIKLGLVAWPKVIFKYHIFYQVFDAGILFMHVIWWYEIWRPHLGALTKQGGWVDAKVTTWLKFYLHVCGMWGCGWSLPHPIMLALWCEMHTEQVLNAHLNVGVFRGWVLPWIRSRLKLIL